MYNAKVTCPGTYLNLRATPSTSAVSLCRLDKGITVATVYLQMAKDHLSLTDKLHSGVETLIAEYKRSGKEAPPVMLELWRYEHEMLVEEQADTKRLIDMF